tara:strand:+ start:1566 stop:4820 length:3255 start_codon:yes stop_codon:yes gene_type:complete
MLELSLKPQNSTSWLYTTTANYTNFLADGTLFSSLTSTTNLSYTTGGLVASEVAMGLSPATGNWQSYYQTGSVFSSSIPALSGEGRRAASPVEIGYFGVKLCNHTNAVDGGNSGVYQRAYGLTNGNKYTVTITVKAPVTINSGDLITIGDIVSNTSTAFTPVAGTSDYTTDFIASDDYADIYIDLFGLVASCFIIKEVKCTEHFSEADLTFSDFADGSVALDLFDDNIPLTLSVTSFTDAATNTQSYSKDFKLPSTKRNDRIFSHIYDLNTSIQDNHNAFNPYIQTIATLKEDGVEIFSGELTLSSVSKNNEGISYDVHLTSRVSGLAKVLKGRKISDIDFNELDHFYTKTNIVNSWTTGVNLINDLNTNSKAYKGSLTSTDVLKYPAVNWTGDIDNSGSNLALTDLEELFRPFINIKYIFERIMDNAGFTFDSDFMRSTVFTKLFMDFNHGENPSSTGGKFNVKYNGGGRYYTNSYTRVEFDDNTVSGAGLNPTAGTHYWDTSDNSFGTDVDGTTFSWQGDINCVNTNNFQKRTVQCRTVVARLNSDGTYNNYYSSNVPLEIPFSLTSNKNKTYRPSGTVTLDVGDKVYFEVKTNTSTSGQVRQSSVVGGAYDNTYMTFYDISNTGSVIGSLISKSRGEIKQWDFMKSLINMFNLVISPDSENPNHLTIEPYDAVFGNTSYGYVLDQPIYGLADNYAVVGGSITMVEFSGRMSISSNGSGTVDHGVIGSDHTYVHGETYTVRFNVQSNGGSYVVSMYDGDVSNNPSSGIITSSGEHSFSFVFDKFSSANNDKLKLRIRLSEGNSSAYSVVFNSISVEGMKINDKIKKDWSDKVDMDSFDMKMMDLVEVVEFSCPKDKDDYASNEYSSEVSRDDGEPYNYGDLTYKDSRYTDLEGTEEIKNIVFSSTIVKPIFGGNLSTLIMPAIYKGEEANNFTSYSNAPRILYDNGVKEASTTFSSPTPSQNDGLTGFADQSEYLLFTPFSDIDLGSGVPVEAKSLNWSAKCDEMISSEGVDGLFTEYWDGYYGDLFDADTRMYSVQCLLNHNDISNFKFNNIIVIENSEFRVNNINYNAGGMSKVELIKLT